MVDDYEEGEMGEDEMQELEYYHMMLSSRSPPILVAARLDGRRNFERERMGRSLPPRQSVEELESRDREITAAIDRARGWSYSDGDGEGEDEDEDEGGIIASPPTLRTRPPSTLLARRRADWRRRNALSIRIPPNNTTNQSADTWRRPDSPYIDPDEGYAYGYGGSELGEAETHLWDVSTRYRSEGCLRPAPPPPPTPPPPATWFAGMDPDLQCPICYERTIEVEFACKHGTCEYCYGSWVSAHHTYPLGLRCHMCRRNIESSEVVSVS
jgi:hypothetical protein